MNLTISVIAKLSKYSFEFREALDIYKDWMNMKYLFLPVLSIDITLGAREQPRL